VPVFFPCACFSREAAPTILRDRTNLIAGDMERLSVSLGGQSRYSSVRIGAAEILDRVILSTATRRIAELDRAHIIRAALFAVACGLDAFGHITGRCVAIAAIRCGAHENCARGSFPVVHHFERSEKRPHYDGGRAHQHERYSNGRGRHCFCVPSARNSGTQSASLRPLRGFLVSAILDEGTLAPA
jgi:hypothetical protein